MNKLFNKIATGIVSIAMAVGVGVAIGSGSKDVRSVKAANATYNLVESNLSDWSGTYIIYSTQSNKLWDASSAISKSGTYVSVTPSNKTITTNTSYEWTIEKIGTTNTYSIKSQAASNPYIKGGASSGNVSTNATAQAHTIEWKSASNFEIYDGSFYMRGNSGYIRYYSSSTQGSTIALYKKSSSKTLSSITISTPPSKTSYYVGESFDSTGMVVTATYSDASTANVTSSCTFTPETFSATGTQNVTASYTYSGTTRTATQSVTVSANSLSSITISGYNTTLEKGGAFSFGGTVTAHYLSGSTDDVTSSATFSGYNMSAVGDQTVTVSYTESGVTRTATYTLTVVNLLTITLDPTETSSFPYQGITLSVSSGTLTNETDYRVYKGSNTITVSSSVGNILKIELTYESASYDGGGWDSEYTPNDSSWTSPGTNGEQAHITLMKVYVPKPDISANITGPSSVNSGSQWSSTGIVDENQQTVSGATYSFVAGSDTTITASDTTNGTFTATTVNGGSVTVKATASGYVISDFVVTINSTAPYIHPDKSSTSGYTGCNETIEFAYGNLTGTLGVSTSGANLSAVIQNDDGENADVVITFNTATANNSYVYLKDGNTTLATITVTSIIASGVSITGLPATATLYNDSTLNLGSQITVTATGSCSSNVTWESDDEAVATVNNSGVVTPVANGEVSITVTADDDSSATMTCVVTVSDAPKVYTITGPSTTQASGTGLTVDTLNTYYPIDNNAYIEWTAVDGSAYGSSTSAMRFGTGTATATGYVTLSLKSGAPIYFTKVVVNAKTWSAETGNTLKVNDETVEVSSSYDDYEFTIDSDVTSINFGNGTKRVNIYAIDVYYEFKTPELHVSSSSVEAVINSNNTYVELTSENYSATSYEAVVKSGSSLTASAVSFDTSSTPHKAKFTTGSNTGATVFTITGTGGGKTASVDVTVTVTNPRNITGISITTAGTPSFKVGETFDVGSLVVTATYDAEPTTVVYSKANDNLGELTFSPAIGYEFDENDIGSKTITISKSYGSGSASTSYTVTVSDKDYATLVTSVTDLWDGQQVYFSNSTDMTINKYVSGNNVGSSSATFHNTKGLDIASTNGYAYTIGRTKVDNTIYYTFSLEDGGNTYYLKDNGTSGNYLARTTDTSDDAIYWTISAGANSGQWAIVNKSVTARPNLQINGNLMACYNNTQTNPYLYKVTTYSEQAVADAFVERYLHMSEEVEGQCNTYYPILKPVWAAMGEYEKAAISAEAEARLIAWAAAHGEHLNSDMDLVANAKFNLIAHSVENSGAALIIIIVSVISAAAIGGYFFLRKKKED